MGTSQVFSLTGANARRSGCLLLCAITTFRKAYTFLSVLLSSGFPGWVDKFYWKACSFASSRFRALLLAALAFLPEFLLSAEASTDGLRGE